jgi:hypothetical protein
MGTAGFTLAVELAVTLPSVADRDAAVELVRGAHHVCPYFQRHQRQHRREADGQRRSGGSRGRGGNLIRRHALHPDSAAPARDQRHRRDHDYRRHPMPLDERRLRLDTPSARAFLADYVSLP